MYKINKTKNIHKQKQQNFQKNIEFGMSFEERNFIEVTQKDLERLKKENEDKKRSTVENQEGQE